MRQVRFFVRVVQNLSDWTGKIVSVLIFPMIFILVWEVLLRYVFNSPTIWAHETSEFFYGAYFLLGGAYVLYWGSHVNVGIVYDRFPLRLRAIVDLLTWMFFYFFCGVLAWRGGEVAWLAVVRMEYSHTPWGPPVWPIKLTIPLAAGLILLQGLTKTINDLYTAIKGRGL